MMHLRAIIKCYRSHHTKCTPEYTILPQPISSFLQNNAKSKSIKKCRQIHAKLIITNTISNVYATNTLLNFYSRCQDPDQALHLFNQAPDKNVVTWTSMISSYVHHGYFNNSFQLFKQMLESGEKPNQFTLSVVIRASVNLNFLPMGIQIHGLIVGFGLERNEYTGSSLVDMYFKLGGSLDDAHHVFDELYHRDSVTWNILISGFAQVGEVDQVLRLFWEMQVVYGLSPDDFTFTSLLKCCCCLIEVELIHGLVLKFGSETDVVVGSALVDLYGKCGNVDLGRKILDSMRVMDSFVWSSIISGYSRNGKGEDALLSFRSMCRQGVNLDQHALSSALKACVDIGGIGLGIQIHGQMIKNGFEEDGFVASALLILYADFKKKDEVEKVFRVISDGDIVLWNSMIMACANTDEGSVLHCMELYHELRQTKWLEHDGTTLVAVLKSCQSESDLQMGLQIHTQILKLRHRDETLVGNAVISMYSACGVVEDARKAFDSIVYRDDVSWSSIIGSYVRNGVELEALRLCKQMLGDGGVLSCFSLPSCITACASLAAMDLGKQFHSFIIKLGFETDVYVGSSVVDMYAKCGSMRDSIKAFNEQCNPNAVTFNALIAGFAQHGRADEAIKTFEEMEKMSITPNKITFLAVISACSHAGLVEKSVFLFDLMHQKYGVQPETEHYSCLVDVFGRAGRLDEAYTIICNSEGDSAWRTLLSACRSYENMVIGEKFAKKVMELNPNDHASYVLLSNLYSITGKWEDARELRQKMTKFGVKKDPGSSWLIVRDWVHEFTVGDFSHPEIERILRELNLLNQHAKIVDPGHFVASGVYLNQAWLAE